MAAAAMIDKMGITIPTTTEIEVVRWRKRGFNGKG